MSHGTEGAVRAESSLFELCRIASEEDEVKSRKSRKVLSSENRAKCIWTMSSREELRWKQMFFSHTDRTDHTDFIYCPAEMKEIKEIIFDHGLSEWYGYYISRRTEGAVRAESSLFELCRIASEEDEVKSQIAQKGFSDGFIEGGFSIYKNELLSYFSHHQWLIHLAEWIRVWISLKSLWERAFNTFPIN